MRYYILYPDNTEADTINDINQLGDDNGFGVFWANRGLNVLMNAVEQQHSITEHLVIKDEKAKSYSIEEFLDKIKSLKVRIQEQNMSKINLNDLDRYVETHQPIQKIRKKKKLKDQESKTTDKKK